MKKAILILAGLAVLLVSGLGAVAWYALNKNETDKKNDQTRPAREARAAKIASKENETPLENGNDETKA